MTPPCSVGGAIVHFIQCSGVVHLPLAGGGWRCHSRPFGPTPLTQDHSVTHLFTHTHTHTQVTTHILPHTHTHTHTVYLLDHTHFTSGSLCPGHTSSFLHTLFVYISYTHTHTHYLLPSLVHISSHSQDVHTFSFDARLPSHRTGCHTLRLHFTLRLAHAYAFILPAPRRCTFVRIGLRSAHGCWRLRTRFVLHHACARHWFTRYAHAPRFHARCIGLHGSWLSLHTHTDHLRPTHYLFGSLHTHTYTRLHTFAHTSPLCHIYPLVTHTSLHIWTHVPHIWICYTHLFVHTHRTRLRLRTYVLYMRFISFTFVQRTHTYLSRSTRLHAHITRLHGWDPTHFHSCTFCTHACVTPHHTFPMVYAHISHGFFICVHASRFTVVGYVFTRLVYLFTFTTRTHTHFTHTHLHPLVTHILHTLAPHTHLWISLCTFKLCCPHTFTLGYTHLCTHFMGSPHILKLSHLLRLTHTILPHLTRYTRITLGWVTGAHTHWFLSHTHTHTYTLLGYTFYTHLHSTHSTHLFGRPHTFTSVHHTHLTHTSASHHLFGSIFTHISGSHTSGISSSFCPPHTPHVVPLGPLCSHTWVYTCLPTFYHTRFHTFLHLSTFLVHLDTFVPPVSFLFHSHTHTFTFFGYVYTPFILHITPGCTRSLFLCGFTLSPRCLRTRSYAHSHAPRSRTRFAHCHLTTRLYAFYGFSFHARGCTFHIFSLHTRYDTSFAAHTLTLSLHTLRCTPLDRTSFATLRAHVVTHHTHTARVLHTASHFTRGWVGSLVARLPHARVAHVYGLPHVRLSGLVTFTRSPLVYTFTVLGHRFGRTPRLTHWFTLFTFAFTHLSHHLCPHTQFHLVASAASHRLVPLWFTHTLSHVYTPHTSHSSATFLFATLSGSYVTSHCTVTFTTVSSTSRSLRLRSVTFSHVYIYVVPRLHTVVRYTRLRLRSRSRICSRVVHCCYSFPSFH